MMSTHGNIRIRQSSNSQSYGKMEYWLHAYHTGHSTQALTELISMPAFYVNRAVMEYRLQMEPFFDESIEEKDHPWRRSEYGILGTGELSLWGNVYRKPEDWMDKGYQSLDDVFQGMEESGTFRGLRESISASYMANLMIQRTSGKWHVIAEEDAPWHDVGSGPDIEVVVNSNENIYRIHNHWIDEQGDDIKRGS